METVLAAGPEPVSRWTIFLALVRGWRVVAAVTLAGGFVGLGVGHFLPRWYEASLQLALTPVDDPTTPGLTNAVEGAGAELPLLATIIGSRQVADEAVAELSLQKVYRSANAAEARAELARHLRVVADKKANVVTITVEDRDAKRARELARVVGETAVRESAALWTARTRQHRARLEARLSEVARDLEQAEHALGDFRTRHRVVDLTEQTRATVNEAAVLEHLRIEKRLALDFARGFGGDDAEEVKRAAREANGVNHAAAALTHGERAVGPLLPLDALPSLGIEHDRLKRAVDVEAERYTLLARQVEQLRAVETRPTGQAEVVDPPVVPYRPARPAKAMIATEGLLCGFLLAAAFVLVRAFRRMRLDHSARPSIAAA